MEVQALIFITLMMKVTKSTDFLYEIFVPNKEIKKY